MLLIRYLTIAVVACLTGLLLLALTAVYLMDRIVGHLPSLVGRRN